MCSRLVFFFSSRRRHTRCLSDWSSDVCSSDLIAVLKQHGAELVLHGHEHLDLVRWFDTPNGKVPAVGVPSASATVGWKYDARSEERRVGKECRSRGSQCE